MLSLFQTSGVVLIISVAIRTYMYNMCKCIILILIQFLVNFEMGFPVIHLANMTNFLCILLFIT